MSTRRFLVLLALVVCALAPSIVAGDDRVDAVAGDDAETAKRVEQLIEELRDRDVNKRRDAAYELDQLGEKAAAAVAELSRALDDGDRQVWFFSVSALARIGPTAAPAIPTLLRGLDRDSQRRYRSAYALGRIGKAAEPDLVKALKSGSSYTRGGAALALGWISPLSDDARTGLIERLADDDEEARGRASEALANDAPRSIPALAKALESGNRAALRSLGLIDSLPETLTTSLVAALGSESAETRQLAIRAMRRVETSAPENAASIAEALVGRLGDADASVRAELRLTLVRLGPERVAPLLVDTLESGEDTAVESAAMVLAEMDATRLPSNEKSAAALVAALVRVESDSAREALARTCGRAGAELVPALLGAAANVEPGSPASRGIASALGAVGEAAMPGLIAALSSESPRVRTIAANAIAASGAEAGSALDALVKALGDRRPGVRAASARAIAALGKEAAPAEPRLVEATMDTDPATRAGAIAALVASGSNSERLLPVLTRAISDGAPSIRAQALEAVVGLGDDARTAGPAVLGALNDGEPAVRAIAARAIGTLKITTPEAITGLSNLLSAASDDTVREAALESLGSLGEAATPSLGAIAALLTPQRVTDENDTLAIAAAVALERLAPHVQAKSAKSANAAGRKSAGERLETALREGHPKLQAVAARAFGKLVDDPRVTVPVFVAMLDDDSGEVRREVMDELGDIGSPAQAAVRPLFEKMTSSRYERRIAYEALDRIGPRDVELLIGALDNGSRYTRAFAARHLGRMGRDAREAAPALGEALRREDDSRARQEMREALEKIAPGAKRKGF